MLVLRSTIFQPYKYFSEKNSSELVSAITLKSHSIVYQTLLPIVELVSSGILLLAVSLVILYISPTVAVFTVTVVAVFYFTISRFMKNTLRRNSEISDVQQNKIFKVVNETILAIKEIKVSSMEEKAISLFHAADLAFRSAKKQEFKSWRYYPDTPLKPSY